MTSLVAHHPQAVQLVVGKIDAGVAILLTGDHHILEFPTLLLPPDIATGSIIDVAVSRNIAAEQATLREFSQLQHAILAEFGDADPAAPVVHVAHAAHDSVLLKWDHGSVPTDADAAVLGLDVVINNHVVHTVAASAVVAAPSAGDSNATLRIAGEYRVRGLQPGYEYSCWLVLRTASGTVQSDAVVARTKALGEPVSAPASPSPAPAAILSKPASAPHNAATAPVMNVGPAPTTAPAAVAATSPKMPIAAAPEPQSRAGPAVEAAVPDAAPAPTTTTTATTTATSPKQVAAPADPEDEPMSLTARDSVAQHQATHLGGSAAAATTSTPTLPTPTPLPKRTVSQKKGKGKKNKSEAGGGDSTVGPGEEAAAPAPAVTVPGGDGGGEADHEAVMAGHPLPESVPPSPSRAEH
ncbi:Chitin synthase, class 5 [Allomyces arbusculus]|nr:Chitin synthase, class 5 [Allomyces arbusculus]